MRSAPLLRVMATAAAAVACVAGNLATNEGRFELLDRGFAARQHDPARAAELFAEAGAGTILERVRLEAWFDVLQTAGGEVAQWREFLASGPPADLASRATLELAEALMKDGREAEAAAVLQASPAIKRAQADEMLVALGEGPWREPAGRRLAVAAPHRLRSAAPDLERRLLPVLTADERLERSQNWLAVGAPRTAASELRNLRWRGKDEQKRRLAVARAEVAAGSPSRALQLLPSVARAGVEELLVRGEAYRRRAWQRAPSRSSRAAFAGCLEAAERMVAAAEADDPLRTDGLRLVVECGTEAGALDRALAAWFALEAAGWTHDQRGWLGRRLGVAVAQRQGDMPSVSNLASTLPVHTRCLRFWSALSTSTGREELRQLASAPIPDIYGTWARELLDETDPPPVELRRRLQPCPPPRAVQWLIDRQALPEAAREWRRIHLARGSTPSEALAAADYANSRGRRNEAIRWLREAFPELGTVEMWRAPSNVVREYLPLRWEDALRAAAAESGVEPWLVAAVGRQESTFSAHSRSSRGAVGVLQLMPGTARVHARALGLGDQPDLYDPGTNLRVGARELARLLRKFGGVEPALAAYNAGETRVRGWWRERPDRHRFTEAIPIPETYNYVRRVRYLAEAYRRVYADLWGRPP